MSAMQSDFDFKQQEHAQNLTSGKHPHGSKTMIKSVDGTLFHFAVRLLVLLTTLPLSEELVQKKEESTTPFTKHPLTAQFPPPPRQAK